MAKAFQLAIALIFFFMADHAEAYPFPVQSQAPLNELPVLQAQFQLDLGGASDGEILGFLSSQGYSDIKITKKRFAKARAEACRNGIRYDVEVEFDGRIRRATEIGKCRSVIERELGSIIERELGGASDGEILGFLSSQGYSDIRITKKRFAKARAEACRNGIRYDVEVEFDGRIRRATEIGKCRSVTNLEFVRNILRQKGFREIRLGSNGAGFVAAACRGNRRFRVFLGQFGDIQEERVLGPCGGILTEYDITALLRAQGFSRVLMNRDRRGNFSVNACRGNDEVTLLVSNDGAILRERRVGRCEVRW